MLPLDAFTFDTSNWTPSADSAAGLAWRTPAGDTVDLSARDVLRDFPLTSAALSEHRELLAELAVAKSAGLVEAELSTVKHYPALVEILRIAQQPTGRTYIGSLSILIHDTGYVVRVVCHEHGTTGVRDTALVHRFLDSGQVRFTAEASQRAKAGLVIGPDGMDGLLVDWLRNRVPAHLARTHCEDHVYDDDFPDHPLSRVRRLIAHVQATGTIRGESRSGPVSGASPSSRWWSRMIRRFGAA